MNLILPLINILMSVGETFVSMLYSLILTIDGVAYSLVGYSFKVFTLMCSLNFNSLYGIISPLTDRLQAVIIVFVVYQLGISLINFMLNPDDAIKDGSKLLKNIFIAAALFVSYNFVFSVFNEVNILLMGNTTGYKYTTLAEVFDLTGTENNGQKDDGVIIRFIFGKSGLEGRDPSQSIAVHIADIFIRDANNPSNSKVAGIACSGTTCDFDNLKHLAPEIASGDVKHTFLLGFAAALFVAYSIFNISIQVGIRMFKLLLLQILAPLVIVSVIKDGIKGDKFKKYLQTYWSVFIEAFTRMLVLLVAVVFVSKFVMNITTFVPTIAEGEDLATRGIIIILVIVAAFLFAGKVPEFIDNVLGTKLASNKATDFMGGLLGSVAGGVIGGAAGGGLGGAIAGLGSGLVNGFKSGVKGEKIADTFKKRKGEAKATGQQIRNQGGLPNYVAGGIGRTLGLDNAQDRKLANLERQKNALEAYSDAQANAIKELKTGAQVYNSDGIGQAVDTIYVAGYKSEKLGDDKGNYAERMLKYNRAFIEAEAALEAAKKSGDSEAINTAMANYVTHRSQAIKTAEDHYDYVKSQAGNIESDAIVEAMDATFAAADTEEGKFRRKTQAAFAEDVKVKYNSYEAKGGDLHTAGHNYKTEKQRIYAEEAKIKNTDSYANLHGQKPKS